MAAAKPDLAPLVAAAVLLLPQHRRRRDAGAVAALQAAERALVGGALAEPAAVQLLRLRCALLLGGLPGHVRPGDIAAALAARWPAGGPEDRWEA